MSVTNEDLLTAISDNDAVKVKQLLSSDLDLNQMLTEEGYSALHFAAMRGSIDIVKTLIETERCDANELSLDGLNPLLISLMYGHSGLASIFIQLTSNLEHPGQDGYTALHLAVASGMTDVVQLLLKSKVNVNARTDDGFTALHIAASMGDVELIEVLLSNNENGNVDINGNLMSNRPDVNCRSQSGYTPLLEAVEGGFERVVSLLLLWGADPNLASEEGVSPLFMAVDYRFKRIVKLLLDCSDINIQQTSMGVTPLELATSRNYHRIAKMLTRHEGATESAQNTEDVTSSKETTSEDSAGTADDDTASIQFPALDTVFNLQWREVAAEVVGSVGDPVATAVRAAATNTATAAQGVMDRVAGEVDRFLDELDRRLDAYADGVDETTAQQEAQQVGELKGSSDLSCEWLPSHQRRTVTATVTVPRCPVCDCSACSSGDNTDCDCHPDTLTPATVDEYKGSYLNHSGEQPVAEVEKYVRLITLQETALTERDREIATLTSQLSQMTESLAQLQERQSSSGSNSYSNGEATCAMSETEQLVLESLCVVVIVVAMCLLVYIRTRMH